MSLARPPAALLATAGKRLVAVAVFVTTLMAWAWAEPMIANRTPLPGGGATTGDCAIWFIGSSTVAQWRSVHSDMAPWIAYGRGVDGAELDQLTQRLAIDPPAPAPLAVVIYAGENDIANGASARVAAQGVKQLVAMVRARMPRTHIFVVATKPSPARWVFRAEQRRFDATMRGWRAAVFIDVADTLLVDGHPGAFYKPDAIHLNATGYARWGRRVRARVEEALPRPTVARCTAATRSPR